MRLGSMISQVNDMLKKFENADSAIRIQASNRLSLMSQRKDKENVQYEESEENFVSKRVPTYMSQTK